MKRTIIFLFILLAVLFVGMNNVYAEGSDDEYNVKLVCEKDEVKAGQKVKCDLFFDGLTEVPKDQDDNPLEYKFTLSTNYLSFTTIGIFGEEDETKVYELMYLGNFPEDLEKPIETFFFYAPENIISLTEQITITSEDGSINNLTKDLNVVGSFRTDDTSEAHLELACPRQVKVGEEAVCDIRIATKNTLVNNGSYEVSVDVDDFDFDTPDFYAKSEGRCEDSTCNVIFSRLGQEHKKIGELKFTSDVEKEVEVKLNDIVLGYGEILKYEQQEQVLKMNFVNTVTNNELIISTGTEIEVTDVSDHDAPIIQITHNDEETNENEVKVPNTSKENVLSIFAMILVMALIPTAVIVSRKGLR